MADTITETSGHWPVGLHWKKGFSRKSVDERQVHLLLDFRARGLSSTMSSLVLLIRERWRYAKLHISCCLNYLSWFILCRERQPGMLVDLDMSRPQWYNKTEGRLSQSLLKLIINVIQHTYPDLLIFLNVIILAYYCIVTIPQNIKPKMKNIVRNCSDKVIILCLNVL